MKYRADATMPLPKLLLADAVGLVLCWGPGILAWSAALLYLNTIWQSPHFWLASLATPFLLVAVFLLATLFFRLSIPRLKPGVYSLTDGMVRAWYMHFVLSSGIYASGLMPLIFTTYLTRFLYFRAMGARVGYGVHLSIFTRFREYPLLSIGNGTSLSANVHIACHTHVGDRLMLGNVEIGERCFIGMDTTIGPKTRLGDDCWIGLGNRFLMMSLPNGTRAENFEYERGPRPKVAATQAIRTNGKPPETGKTAPLM